MYLPIVPELSGQACIGRTDGRTDTTTKEPHEIKAMTCRVCLRHKSELHNETAFRSLAHARALIAEWREDYNRSRPHTSLGGLTPAEFAARAEEAPIQNGLSL